MSNNIDTWTWRTRWALRRNRILASPAFQRWAARTPLFRGIARRRAAAQFDLVAGFLYSQILLAAVESDLLTALADAPLTERSLRAVTGLEAEALHRLLRAAAALELVESPQHGLWTLGEAGAPLVHNGGVLAMIRHHRLVYADWADPMALLRANRAGETRLSAFWSYAARAPDAAAPVDGYSALMAATQPMVADQILGSYRFAQHRKILDVGGGTGAFVRALGGKAPAAALGVFDLPEVVAAGQAGDSNASPIQWHGGNFTRDALPAGYDLITLNRIAHDHDDDVVAALFQRIHGALSPGGTLLIVEPMAGKGPEGRVGDAYFGLYLWAMGSGRARTAAELAAMLRAADFAQIRRIATPLPLVASALVATK